MAIKRYVASADSTITNAFKSDLTTRGTGSNMGLADILETFTIYGQANSASLEKARVLVNFPVSTITTDRSAGTIPGSGSVSFYLRLFNAEHGQTLPRNSTLEIKAVLSASWEEGFGLDMEGYTDATRDSTGVNWIYAKEGTAWLNEGGDYSDPDMDASSSFTQTLTEGDEDIEVDVTTLVEQWLNSGGNVLGSKSTYGLGVMFSSSHESATRSFYTKKFFARSSEFFFKRPVLEARWDSSKKDDRAKVYYSSSLVSGEDNLNTIYLYNYVRGHLRDLPHDSLGNTSDTVYVSFFSGNAGNTEPNSIPLLLPAGGGVASANDRNVTGSRVSTGIYKAKFALTSAKTPVGTIYDVWHNSHSLDGGGADHLDLGEIQFKTGSFKPRRIDSYDIAPTDTYVTSITNLRKSYATNETARFRLYVRPKDWNPTAYSVASSEAENTTIDSGSFRVFRVIDDYEAVAYGTGSDLHTMMSHDLSGNYFDLDMSLLEPDYMYGVRFAYYNGSVGDWMEQPEVFKFRVE